MNGTTIEKALRNLDDGRYSVNVRFMAHYIDGTIDKRGLTMDGLMDALANFSSNDRHRDYVMHLVKEDEVRESALQRLQRLGGDSGTRCRRCKGTAVACEMKQTRSADEGMTAFYSCADCGAKWHE